MAKEQETSDFASVGSAPFPPIYEDSQVCFEFSDEKKWPIKKLLGRLALYQTFLKEDDPMPRAVEGASRIALHLTFESEYKKGPKSFNAWIRDRVLTQQMEKVVDDGCEDTSV